MICVPSPPLVCTLGTHAPALACLHTPLFHCMHTPDASHPSTLPSLLLLCVRRSPMGALTAPSFHALISLGDCTPLLHTPTPTARIFPALIHPANAILVIRYLPLHTLPLRHAVFAPLPVPLPPPCIHAYIHAGALPRPHGRCRQTFGNPPPPVNHQWLKWAGAWRCLQVCGSWAACP